VPMIDGTGSVAHQGRWKVQGRLFSRAGKANEQVRAHERFACVQMGITAVMLDQYLSGASPAESLNQRNQCRVR
jgi:hypothetical protein